MKFLQIEKGSYKYIEKQRVIEIIKTVFMYALSLSIYFIGLKTLGTNKSLWTIIAVLGILPASKCAVNMIMFIKNKSINIDEYNEIEEARKDIPVLYELVFTTQETSFYVNSMACCNATVIAYSKENDKKQKKLNAHILDSISREELKGYSLKIYGNRSEYIKRLKEMNENMNYDNDRSSERLFALMKAITI